MRNKTALIFTGILFSIFMLNAQQSGPNISFKETEHSFGKIEENKGSVTHKFTFTNTGSQPLIINRVQASCGCTTPSYSKKPVLPGEEGYIEVKFNPKNRPGPFQKSISVYSNSPGNMDRLIIKGSVIAGEKPISEIYRVKMGELRLKSRTISVASVDPSEKKSQKMEIYNDSDQPLTVDFVKVPNHISIKTDPGTIPPRQKAQLETTFDASQINDWGSVNYWIRLNLNGNVTKYRLFVHANIEEDFSKLSEKERANAPKAVFSNEKFNFGTIQQGEKVDHEYMVTNNGKSDLIIRKVSASCGCTAVKPENNVIKPGESTEIKVIFNSRGKSGSQSKAVTVITNDPENHKKILWVRGTVQTGS
jgi:hypothetical protein